MATSVSEILEVGLVLWTAIKTKPRNQKRGLFVRIGDDVLKTVVFVGLHPEGGVFVPLGTGFLVNVTIETVFFPFVVTARHVLDLVQGPNIAVRYNERSGRAITQRVPLEHCFVGKDRAKDVAGIPISIDTATADQMMIPMDRAEWESARKEVWEEKLGDEIVTLGLYSSHFGELKNIPVVRVGHIAMMPGEPVRTSSGYVQAYLVEVKSIAGLSGSPVFVNMPDLRLNSNAQLEYMPERRPLPIGMMLGYHVVESADDIIPVAQIQGGKPPTQLSLDERNTGFAVVLPITEIFAIFANPGLQNAMKEAAQQLRRG